MSSDSVQGWKRRARRTRRGRRSGASTRAHWGADFGKWPSKQPEASAVEAAPSEEPEASALEAAPSEDEEVEHAIVAVLPSRPEQDEVEDQEEQSTNAQEETPSPHLAPTLQAKMLGLSSWASPFQLTPSITPDSAHDDPHDSTFTLTSRPHGSLVQEVTSLGNGLSRRGDRSVEKPREESQQPEDGGRTGLRAAESRRDKESSEGEVV